MRKPRIPERLDNEKLAQRIQAAFTTDGYDKNAPVAPVRIRENILMTAMEAIAKGEVKLAQVRAYAAEALRIWHEARKARDE